MFAGGFIYYPDNPKRVWSMDKIGKAVFYYQRELNEPFMSAVTRFYSARRRYRRWRLADAASRATAIFLRLVEQIDLPMQQLVFDLFLL